MDVRNLVVGYVVGYLPTISEKTFGVVRTGSSEHEIDKHPLRAYDFLEVFNCPKPVPVRDFFSAWWTPAVHGNRRKSQKRVSGCVGGNSEAVHFLV